VGLKRGEEDGALEGDELPLGESGSGGARWAPVEEGRVAAAAAR